ncbi:MAG: Gfo/Idh/MocA family protein [Acidimicrobiales bacterium]
MRVGVVGTGFGARVVAPVFGATPGVEVAEVVSARDDAAVAALCGRRDLDLISIHSPPFLHTRHVGWALDAGHGAAVLCDKPFGRSAAEADAMVSAAEAAGVVHLVNFEFRFLPGRVALGEVIRSGAIGEVEHLLWTHHSAGSRVPMRPAGWLFDRSLGGGWLGAWGSHAVDALRVWFGELVVLGATLRTVVGSRPAGEGSAAVDAEDGFCAALAAASGRPSVTLDSGFAASVDLAPRITVFGSEGTVESVADHRITLRRPGADPEPVPLAVPSPVGSGAHRSSTGTDRHGGPVASWAEVVRDAVHEGRQISPSFADGLACARVLDAVRSAACTPAPGGDP